MDTYGKTAVWVGALFIIALVTDLIASAIYNPVLGADDYLIQIAANESRVTIGLLFEFTAAIAIILIPVVLFPVLRKFYEWPALAYVLFRLFEGILLVFIIVSTLTLFNISQDYVESGASQASSFQVQGDSIQAWHDWAVLFYIAIFTLGALIFYGALFKSKLVPAFISIWGFIAAFLLLIGALLGILDLFDISLIKILFGALVALNEITLSIWLIVKKFNQPAINTLVVS